MCSRLGENGLGRDVFFCDVPPLPPYTTPKRLSLQAFPHCTQFAFGKKLSQGKLTMRKKICAHTTPVLKTGYRTYIEFSAPASDGNFQRFRLSFNLNRITNLAERRRRGEELCLLLSAWMRDGRYVDDFDEVIAHRILYSSKKKKKRKQKKKKKLFSQLSLRDGFRQALKYACHGLGHNTLRTRHSVAKLFLEWCKENHLMELKISELKDRHAARYLDYLDFEQGVSWRTWNNKKRELRIIFNALLTRKMIKKNPFRSEKFPDKKGKGLKHEVLPFEEAKIIIDYLHDHDKYLFFFILIEFFGFVRPSEIRERLKKYHFKLSKGLIEVPGEKNTKTSDTKWITIPEEFMDHFYCDWFKQIPRHYYVFGKDGKPNTKPAGKDKIYRRYGRVIEYLYKQGIINKKYTQLYDWKRRGITEFLKILPPAVVRDQAGHSRMESTLIYHHPEKFSQEISKSRTDLISQ